MGFSFRKSFGSGPFRMTVSPRGVTSSFGVRGARISSGPRGTFVTLSSHGVSYRHRIDTPAPHKTAPATSVQGTEPPPILDSVFQVPITELIASNQTELVSKLNENVSATNPAGFVAVISCLALFSISTYPITGIVVLIAGLSASIWLHQRFKEAHTQEIHYSLDEQAIANFRATQSAISSLSDCSNVWTLQTQAATHDLKRNAGASTLITRKTATIGNLPTKGFKPSLPISSVAANGTIIHFLPDQVLFFSGNRYASAEYSQLKINAVPTRYIEAESVPRDSTQVDTTWRFVNKNGGPDRRFNNNRQLPILQYGEITLRTDSGLHVILQTSSYNKAAAFAAGFNISKPAHEQPRSNGTGQNRHGASSTLLDCYALLGITRPCTLEQASAAHRHQALLYHPDKYEHLAPEMKELASVKMQAINAAFSRVKLDIAN